MCGICGIAVPTQLNRQVNKARLVAMRDARGGPAHPPGAVFFPLRFGWVGRGFPQNPPQKIFSLNSPPPFLECFF